MMKKTIKQYEKENYLENNRTSKISCQKAKYQENLQAQLFYKNCKYQGNTEIKNEYEKLKY